MTEWLNWTELIVHLFTSSFHSEEEARRIADSMTIHSWTTQTIPETVYLQTSLPHTRALCFKGTKNTWALLDAMCMWLVAQKYLSLCDVLDCSPPGSTVHGILQARILESVANPFSRGFPDPGIEPGSPALQADFFFFYHLSHQGSPWHLQLWWGPGTSALGTLRFLSSRVCSVHETSLDSKEDSHLRNVWMKEGKTNLSDFLSSPVS